MDFSWLEREVVKKENASATVGYIGPSSYYIFIQFQLLRTKEYHSLSLSLSLSRASIYNLTLLVCSYNLSQSHTHLGLLSFLLLGFQWR